MTDYIVVANKLNFRDAPRTGDVIAVLPRGHTVSGGPVAGDEEWLQVTALLPQGTADAGGFVAASFVEPEDGAAPKPKAGEPAGPTLAQMRKLAPTGKDLILQLGYRHEIKYPIPEGITVKAEKPTALTISGADRQNQA